tara:strand:- start:37 stop:258 length:222 start_codon:yes stop_codon:yes gene_type:complete
LKNNNKKDSQKFEEAFNRLKEVVSLIENSDDNIEDLVKLVEEGMQLSKLCQEKLKVVQGKINVINDKYKADLK